MLDRMSGLLVVAASAVLLAAAPASAVVNLQITEIWGGGLSGTEVTSDWFEVTNLGDTAASNLLANPLYMDDGSAAFASSVPMEGIDTIAPGESVIYLTDYEGDWGDLTGGATAFLNMWGPLPGVQIGGVPAGIGLGGSGDAVNIFDGMGTLLASAAYSVETQLESFVSQPDGTWIENTFAKVGVWGAFAGNSGATTTISSPPVGSPGAMVPEPRTMLGLTGGAIVAFAACRRR